MHTWIIGIAKPTLDTIRTIPHIGVAQSCAIGVQTMARKNKLIETAEVLSQAPDSGSGAAPDAVETETVEITKAKRANHELIDASGAVVETEEVATGIRYTLLANNQSFEYQTGLEPGKASTMLAIFGAKTLATNETSAARNNTKGAASPDEQMDAVRERFALLETGAWVDRTREGVGAKVDPDMLAEALTQVKEATGGFKAGDDAASYKGRVRQKIEDDKKWARGASKIPEVAAAYAKLAGRPIASLDDLGDI
jgi:hypothetical protein